MNFVPVVCVQCDDCKDARYKRETLQVKYKGLTITDILRMTAGKACDCVPTWG